MRAETAMWRRELEEFTKRNAGRRTFLEVDDPEVGAQEEVHGLALRGVAYDPRDDRVEIMLGALASVEAHLTRSVSAPTAVDVLSGAGGRDEAVRVAQAGGQTVLKFLP